MTQQMHEALRGLVRALFADGGKVGRAVMLMSALRGEGVSTLARALGRGASARAQRAVTLTDLDLLRDSQFRTFADAAARGGPGLGAGVSGAYAGRIFFAPKEAAGAFTLHRVGATRLLVSHFDAGAIAAGKNVQIVDDDGYWRASRRAAEVTIVDAPALQRSRIGLLTARSMDAVVIVASAAHGSASATMELKAELDARGAPVLGLVYTDADTTALAIEKALSES